MGYNRLPPGPIALAAFEQALRDAGPAGINPSVLANVHVPGLPYLAIEFRLACIRALESRGRCRTIRTPYTRKGSEHLYKTTYYHPCHINTSDHDKGA